MIPPPDPPFAVWIDGPWNGRQIRAPRDLRPVAVIRVDGPSVRPFRDRVAAATAGEDGAVLGRYVRCGRDSGGRPYYWWAGTTDCPVPNGVVLRRVHTRFGASGIELLAQLSTTLGIPKAERAVRLLLQR